MERKSIFITGAASGIGRATAELFHRKGWCVGAYDMDVDGLKTLELELGDGCVTGELDVTDKAAFDAALSAFVEKANDRLDLMFNNAGITVGGFFDDVPIEKIIQMVNVNLIGVLNGVHAAIPYLKQTDNSLCFSTASSASMFGSPRMATYGATKFAIRGFTNAMSVELARYGVRAADVLPGIIDTPLWKASKYEAGKAVSNYEGIREANRKNTDAKRTVSPEEVAKAVWNAYHGTKLHWYVPDDLEGDDITSPDAYEKRRDELIAAAKANSA